MTQHRKREAGAILLTFALFLTLLLGFAALATECGRWYLVRAELSKSVDSGALLGAKNISNPHTNPVTLAQDFCMENFQSGAYGTPGSGTGAPAFTAELVGTNKVKVTGNASAVAILGRMFGFDKIPVTASGAAAMRQVEIMMVLDRSGSMSGDPFDDLKDAAKDFVDFFAESQAKDKMGLISFETGVKVERAMGTNYVTPLKTAIDKMDIGGYTNAEDAIDQADGPSGFSVQTGLPDESRSQQIAIFFSDGHPTAYRNTFKFKNFVYDAVAHCDGNCDENEPKRMDNGLYRTDTGASLNINSRPTGDGVYPASKYGNKVETTRWNAFDVYPVPGYAADAYKIPESKLHDHMCEAAAAMAIAHAKELKAKGITVFAIGLGDEINDEFLKQVASSPDMVYIAPDSSDLQAIFARVAQEIKLRLVS